MGDTQNSIPLSLLQNLLAKTDISKTLATLSRFIETQIPAAWRANIMLYRKQENVLVEGSCAAIPPRPGTDDQSIPVTFDGTTTGRAAFLRQAIRTEDALHDEGWKPYVESARALNIRGVYSLPIVSLQMELLGSLTLYYPNPLLQDPKEKNLLETLAGFAAITIERYNHEQESKQMLTDLWRSEERLKLALKSQKMGVWDWSVQTNALIWDQNMFDLFGLPKEEATGTLDDWSRGIHPEDLLTTKALLEKVFHENWPFDHQFRIIRNGETRFIAAIGHLIRDDQGQALRLTGLNWDITDKVMATRKLENERAKSIASAKMAALGEMASGIAHEINNPLTIILNRSLQLKTQLMEGKLEPTQAISELAKIELTVERIAKIIRGLKAFSRNSDNDLQISCELNSIIEESLALCLERFKKHGIDLRLKGLTNVLRVKCRSAQISQVILNLLNNSFDAIVDCKNPWIEIDIQTMQDRIYIRITDSGFGIPAGIAEKMMDPFFTTKDVGQGTGLGLPISKGIIEDHGGKLQIDPEHAFTSFVIDLPSEKINTALTAPSNISLEHNL